MEESMRFSFLFLLLNFKMYLLLLDWVCTAQASSSCGGFSCCAAGPPGHSASVVAARRLTQLPHGMWDIPVLG